MSSPSRLYDIIMKLLLVGDSGVGKLCLLLRFVEDKFNPLFITTIGIDFKIRTIDVHGRKIKLQVWDTAGQERFRTITTAYYRGAMGIVIVYDTTDARTFDLVENWFATVNQHASDDAQLMLVGNKCDDIENRQVPTDKASALALRLNIPFMEASAKSNEKVYDVFFELASMISERVGDQVEVKEGVNVGQKSGSSGCC